MENNKERDLNTMAMRLISMAYGNAFFVDKDFVDDIECALADLQYYAEHGEEYPLGWKCLWDVLKRIENSGLENTEVNA